MDRWEFGLERVDRIDRTEQDRSMDETNVSHDRFQVLEYEICPKKEGLPSFNNASRLTLNLA